MPFITSNILAIIGNFGGKDLFMVTSFHYIMIILSLVIYSDNISDTGHISKEIIEINQSHKGNSFKFETPCLDVNQIGLFLIEGFLIPETIIMTLSLKKDFFYKANLVVSSQDQGVDLIHEVKNWFETTLNIKTDIYENFNTWKVHWKDKLEIKNWL